MKPEKAIEKLEQGNGEFALTSPEFIEKQTPYAVVISCSDSRVPPEIIFNAGIGELFVIRNAGNIISPEVIGSTEYALAHLKTKLVVILGHSECGAVKAAISNARDSEFIINIAENIKPAVDSTRDLYKTTINNITIQGNKLKTAGSIIPELVNNGEAEIIGGFYCLKSGKTEFFEI